MKYKSPYILNEPRFVPLYTLARRSGIPEAFLKKEADAGRIPYIQAGRRRLFNQTDVEAVLSQQSLLRFQKTFKE